MPKLINISCNTMGLDHANVSLRSTEEGIRCVWTDEHCLLLKGEEALEYDESPRGENISVISWEDWLFLAQGMPKEIRKQLLESIIEGA